jgi:putative membrane protein
MKKTILYLFAILAAYSLRAQSLTSKDAVFAIDAYQCGLLKVRVGELTATKAKSDSVKVLGRQILVEHTKANEQLKTIAVAKNITLPDTLTSEGRKQYNDLSARSGADFDEAFVQLMITEHKKAIDNFKDEDIKGSDTDVRAWASMTLPIVKHHLMQAQDLSVDLDKNKDKANRPGNNSRSRSGADKIGTLK